MTDCGLYCTSSDPARNVILRDVLTQHPAYHTEGMCAVRFPSVDGNVVLRCSILDPVFELHLNPPALNSH